MEQKIIDKILYAISPQKEQIAIWFYGDRIPKYLLTDKNIRLVSSPQKADILIIAKKEPPKQMREFQNKPILVLKYTLLLEYKDAIGAYFWQKGRPNIVFIEPRVKRFNLKLPSEFNRYIESKVW